MSVQLNHSDLYRLPWTLPDNAISWLEPTSACNLYCDGCYRKNEPNAHKSLAQIRQELDVFRRLRKTDGVSIAGDDPLTHPQIERIVEMIAQDGQKPIINTNALLLTKEKLVALKNAGVEGFTFHIDSKQQRPRMKGKTEVELNDLRHYYAAMLAEVGGISCAFNATVYEDTIQYVPDILEWGHTNIDIVNIIVFNSVSRCSDTERLQLLRWSKQDRHDADCLCHRRGEENLYYVYGYCRSYQEAFP